MIIVWPSASRSNPRTRLARNLSLFQYPSFILDAIDMALLGPMWKVTEMDTNIFEWTELDRLTARRDELQSQREATPKGRVGLIKLIDDEIRRIEEHRKRHIAHLTGHIIHRVAC